MTLKKYSFLIFLVLVAPQILSAQPVISYLIPDVGAPGMNTYMEIIAPRDSLENFGVDGFFLGNRSDIIQVVCANPSDSQYVRFGPCIVGWNGRMISTQVFVMPWAQPQSTDWQHGMKIPIQVLFDGDLSNVDTFYIVKPQDLDPGSTFTSTGVIGSGGVWGTRSRRGAMIVDSLILAATGTYTFSTQDCDPFAEGNQGYLPFILISRGKISVASSTVVDASATKIDGGPGGGGGGDGLVCSTKGGDGFTGGGGNAHWYNSCSEAPPHGNGSGVQENGLNGALGGESSTQNEGGGGGTGHPFGVGGNAGYFLSGNSRPPGSYGGGQGGPNCCDPQEGGGGGGGFALRGFDGGVFTTHSSAGNLVGNSELVPVCGGSGGGGGNVNTSDMDGTGAGSGGGAGGAIVLYGKTAKIAGVIQSIGADGQASANTNGAGGGGSSGAIVCGAKLSLSVTKIDVSGGVGGIGQPLNAGQDGGGGSPGRARFDGPISSVPAVTGRASKFTGPSTDASDTVTQTFTLSGSGNGNDIQIYARPLHGQWSQVQLVTNYARFANNWTATITLPGNDSIYLLAAAQKILSPSVNQYSYDPTWVLSQSAANILHVKCPTKALVVSDTAINFGTISLCADLFDTIVVTNIGCENADLSDSIWNPFLGLSAIPNSATLPIRGKNTIIAHLHPLTVGPGSTILSIITSVGTVEIPVTWSVDVAGVSLSVTPASIDLGSIPRCADAFDTIVLRNLGCDSLSVTESLFDTTLGISIFKAPNLPLLSQESGTVILLFHPKQIGSFATSLDLHYGSHDTVLSVAGKVTEGVEAVTFTPPMIDFGTRAKCQAVYDTVYITNTGCDSLHLSALIDDNTSGATITRYPKAAIPKNAHDTLIIAFRPHRTGAISSNILLSYQGNDTTIGISAFGVNDSTPLVLSVTPSITSFLCETQKYDVRLSNPTCDSVTVMSYTISGKDTFDFHFAIKAPLGLPSGASADFSGLFDPQDSGARMALVTLNLLRADGTIIDTSISLQGFGIKQNIRVSLPPALPSVQSLQKVSIPISTVDSSAAGINVFDFVLRMHTDLLTPTGVDPNAGLFAGATVDQFTVYNDSVVIALQLPSLVRIKPGLLCSINCLTYVADTLSTEVAFARTKLALISPQSNCVSTTNVDSVLFTLDPQCGETLTSHFLAGRLPDIRSITPNPGSGSEKISYSLPIPSPVRIEVFNQLGQRLRTLLNTSETAGVHEHEFDISALASGNYLIRVTIDDRSVVRAFELVK